MGRIISVIGPPACGKSLLCEKLSKKTGCELIREFDYMPEEIIKELNESPHSLRTQLWFRNRRVEAMQRARQLSEKTNVIIDTCLLTSEVHINEMNDKFERNIALEMNQQDIRLVGRPDLIIGIMCSEEQMYRFFKKRNGVFEQGKDSFLHHCRIRRQYIDLYNLHPEVMIINTEGMDFNIESDLLKTMALIRGSLKRSGETIER